MVSTSSNVTNYLTILIYLISLLQLQTKLISVVSLFRHTARHPLVQIDYNFKAIKYDGVSSEEGFFKVYESSKEFTSQYQNLINSNYKNIEIYSSNEQRCLETLLTSKQALLNQTFDINKSKLSHDYLTQFKTIVKNNSYQSIFNKLDIKDNTDEDFMLRIHTNPYCRDYYLNSVIHNKRLQELTNNIINDESIGLLVKEIIEINKQKDSVLSSYKNDAFYLLYFSDFININRNDIKNLISSKYHKVIGYFMLNDFYSYYVNYLFDDKEMKLLYSTKFFHTTLEFLDKSLTYNTPKVLLMFAHDLNINNLLRLFEIKVDKVDFNSNFTFELHTSIKDEKELYIIMKYNNKVIPYNTINACNFHRENYCEYNRFKFFISGNILSENTLLSKLKGQLKETKERNENDQIVKSEDL